MDKYTIAPPAGSTNNSVGASDRPWREGHFDSVKLNGGDLGEYLAESTGYGIVSGCEPTISGLTVTVGAGVTHLADGTRKEIAETNITLDNADQTNPRIDIVYIDSTGTVTKATGIPNTYPIPSKLNANSIIVCYVNVSTSETVLHDLSKEIGRNECTPFFFGAFHNRMSWSDPSGNDRTVQFYTSLDGVNFTHVNKEITLHGGDPSIAYNDGKFYVAISDQSGTTYDFTVYVSEDLISWREYKPSIGAYWETSWGYCSRWAPDLFFDTDGTLYVLLSVEYAVSKFDTYIAKCTDLDTLTFENGHKIVLYDGVDTTNLSVARNHIDASVAKKDNTYYMIVKEEDSHNLEIFSSNNIYTGWTKITDNIYGDYLEGPCMKYYDGRWHIWADRYSSKSNYGTSNYIYCESDDLTTFYNFKTLTHNNSTYTRRICHGKVLYVNDKTQSNIITKLKDFTISDEIQPYTPGGLTISNNPVNSVDGDQNHYLETLYVEPFYDYQIFSELKIGNIVNAFNVDKVTFKFGTTYIRYLEIEKSNNELINYVSTPHDETLIAGIFVNRGKKLLPVNTAIPINYIPSNDHTTLGYWHLFDVNIPGTWKGVSTIFQLYDITGDNWDAVYRVAVSRGEGDVNAAGNVMYNFKANPHPIYAVKRNSTQMSIFTKSEDLAQGLSMCFLSAHQYGSAGYLRIATPNTVVADISSLGTVTQLV